jgi:hypothetical protein
MTARSEVTRRGFLGALGAVAVAGFLRLEPWRTLVTYRGPAEAERLAGLFAHTDSARRVGEAYLRTFPDEASIPRLLDRIERRLPGGSRTVREASERTLRALVTDGIREDFRHERSVLVHGWILAETEARLCALAALV